MKTLIVVGVCLLVVGGAILAYRGFSYTSDEKILDIGPIEASAEREKHVSLPAPLGWVLVVGGGLMTVGGIVGSRKTKA